jgi:serine protease Do
MQISIGAAPPEAAQRAEAGMTDRVTTGVGVALAPLDATLRRKLGLAADLRGALVAKVDPAGAAAEEGIRPGDVIVGVDRKAVSDPAQAVAALRAARAAKREFVVLKLIREASPFFVALPLQQA